jgi:hypothetical protein
MSKVASHQCLKHRSGIKWGQGKGGDGEGRGGGNRAGVYEGRGGQVALNDQNDLNSLHMQIHIRWIKW